MGNPAVIPSWLTLIVFAAIGVWLLYKINTQKKHSLIAMIGITWVIFLIWSTGWSPQWVLYLLPLILLSIPPTKSLLLTFGLLFVSLIEWPVLLSHHYFAGLWVIVPIRLTLFVILIFLWWQLSKSTTQEQQIK
jgi:hypothetical protein